ncbi:MAG TPA: hypothetical protein VHW72_01535, partial [Candidatus Angelobacter sp.]|nr:hypothetical protein [Candidatus Angelobacter sp.]
AGLTYPQYDHHLQFEILAYNLIGKWFNLSSSYLGVVQLGIHNDLTAMSGFYTGNSDDNTIRHGKWEWLRINVRGNEPEQLIRAASKRGLIEYAHLNGLFKSWLEAGTSVEFEAIIGRKKGKGRTRSAN